MTDQPPTKEELGRATWTLLHTLATNWPEEPTSVDVAKGKTFAKLLGDLYPCEDCAENFRGHLAENPPRTESREEFVAWACEIHNTVNQMLGKPAFDCVQAEQRWRVPSMTRERILAMDFGL